MINCCRFNEISLEWRREREFVFYYPYLNRLTLGSIWSLSNFSCRKCWLIAHSSLSLSAMFFSYQPLRIDHSAWNKHVGETNLPFFFLMRRDLSNADISALHGMRWRSISSFFLRECTREKKKKILLVSYKKIWSFDCLFFLTGLLFSFLIRLELIRLLFFFFSLSFYRSSSSYISLL